MKIEQINWNPIHSKAPHIERYIVETSPSKILLKLSLLSQIYVIGFMCLFLSMFVFSMTFFSLDNNKTIILLILSFIFLLFYIYLIMSKFQTSTFDKVSQKYFTSKKTEVNFGDIYALQAISKGRSLNIYYELNIILNDGRRYSLCCYSYSIGVKPFCQDINKISKLMNKSILIHDNDKNLIACQEKYS